MSDSIWRTLLGHGERIARLENHHKCTDRRLNSQQEQLNSQHQDGEWMPPAETVVGWVKLLGLIVILVLGALGHVKLGELIPLMR